MMRFTRLTVPEHTGLVGGDRPGAGPLAPHLDPGLNHHLVHPGGHAQLGNIPVPGSAGLVLAVTQGQAGALGQQGSPPGGGLLELGDRGGFLVGGQPPAARRRCGRGDAGCGEKTVGGGAAHVVRVELVFEIRQGPARRPRRRPGSWRHVGGRAGRSRGGEDSTSGLPAGTSEVDVAMMTGAASAAAEVIGG